MYTPEEEIVNYIEEEQPRSIPDAAEKIKAIKAAVHDKYNRRKAISIKIPEYDLERLKAVALREGIPYQTMLNSILHKYLTGQLVERSKTA